MEPFHCAVIGIRRDEILCTGGRYRGVSSGGAGRTGFAWKAFSGWNGFGTLEHPVFDLTASMNNGRFKNADFHELTGELSSDGEWMTIHHAEMTTMTGQHQLSGRIALSGDHELDLKEVSEHTRIENILNLAGIHAPLTGWIQNESTIRGTVNIPEITGRFMAWDGSVTGELYQSVSADYALKEGRVLHVSNGLAYIYGGAATLEGNISEQALDLDLALVDVDIERILRQGPAQEE